MIKTILLVVAVLIVAGFGYAMFAGNGLPVETSEARRGKITEFVDERGETRLPRSHLVTMPFDARVEAIALREGDRVERKKAGSTVTPVARIVPRDMELAVSRAQAAVDRLSASIRENDDVSVETTAHEQTLEMVKSTDASVKAAEKRLTASKARLDFAEENYGRQQSLFDQKQVAKEQRDRAYVAYIEANVEHAQDYLIVSAAKAIHATTFLTPKAVLQYMGRKKLSHDVLDKQLVEAKVQHDQILQNKSRSEMYSPVDGVVLERLVSDERFLSAGTPLLRIGQLELLEVETDVLSQDVVQIKVGCRAEVYGPAIGPAPVEGRVKQVYPSGFTKVSSLGVEQQRVKVLIELPRETLEKLLDERGLGVGYRVRARIYTAEKAGGLVVPRSALFRGADGDWRLFVVRAGRARVSAVKVGLMNDHSVEILDGVAEGEDVILAPETKLTDGMLVRPTARKAVSSGSHAPGQSQ